MANVPRSDKGLRYWLLDNPYIDKLWLFIISVLTVIAVYQSTNAANDAQNVARTANETASRTILLVGQADTLSRQIVDKARFQCEGLNQLRENQGSGLQFTINQTKESLERGLGPALEPFREQIVRQQREREAQLRRLRAHTAEFPVRGHPYRVSCDAAHPLPPPITIRPQPQP